MQFRNKTGRFSTKARPTMSRRTRRKFNIPSPKTHAGYALRVVAAVIITPWVLYGSVVLAERPGSQNEAKYLPATVSASEANVGPKDAIHVPVVEVKSEPDMTKPMRGENGLPSQEQKDVVAAEVIDAAARHGLGEKQKSEMYITILAMMKHESGFNCAAEGDMIGGKKVSMGCLQIRIDIRPVSKEQAQDLRFAVKWTIDRMISFGWKDHPTYAVSKHNGSGPMAVKYAEAVNRTIKHYRDIGL